MLVTLLLEVEFFFSNPVTYALLEWIFTTY
jgi:hypothetical protein